MRLTQQASVSIDQTSNWEILNKLKCVTIICIGSRPGSDFIHSLFDSHPQILSVDGPLHFHLFYQNSKSIWGTSAPFKSPRRVENVSPRDFYYEFAWRNLEKFNSRYDNIENKGALGADRKQYNSVDIDLFVKTAVELLGDRELNSRNGLLAAYGAMALVRGETLENKKVLLHHVHHFEKLPELYVDFPDLKVIGAMRDPRAGYVSQILGWQRYSPEFLDPNLTKYIVARILNEGATLNKYPGVDVRVNLIENLHRQPEKMLRNACQWLGIDFNDCLLKSTWYGKEWWGDALSVGIDKTFHPDMYEKSQKRWHEQLSWTEQVVWSSLMRKKILQYGYDRQYTEKKWLFLVPVLILIPLRFERFLLKKYIKTGQIKKIVQWFVSILKRYFWMYKKYFSIVFGQESVFEVL